MKYCTCCKKERPLKDFAFYTKYPSKPRSICKDCERERSKTYSRRLKNDPLKDEEKAIQEFNNLKAASKILTLFQEGFDISWDGESIITFANGDRRVHAKNANKELYSIIFARYCIEISKKL